LDWAAMVMRSLAMLALRVLCAFTQQNVAITFCERHVTEVYDDVTPWPLIALGSYTNGD
jgi:hypothetical protein